MGCMIIRFAGACECIWVRCKRGGVESDTEEI